MTGGMTDAAISTDLSQGILTVRLTRPETRNAQGPALWRELADVGRTLDPAVRVVVLCADGPAFSAGLDRRMLMPEGIPGEGSMLEFSRMPAEELQDLISTFQGAFSWWRRADVVTVAAVQGHAVGAGFQLALGCDLMVVADDVQLAMKEPSLGLVPDLGGTLPLVEAVGYSRALELVVSGRRVGAEEAVRIGLALKAVPRDELESAASGRQPAFGAHGGKKAPGIGRRCLPDHDHQQSVQRGVFGAQDHVLDFRSVIQPDFRHADLPFRPPA